MGYWDDLCERERRVSKEKEEQKIKLFESNKIVCLFKAKAETFVNCKDKNVTERYAILDDFESDLRKEDTRVNLTSDEFTYLIGLAEGYIGFPIDNSRGMGSSKSSYTMGFFRGGGKYADDSLFHYKPYRNCKNCIDLNYTIGCTENSDRLKEKARRDNNYNERKLKNGR